MCLIALALDTSEAWPVVVAGNRDEFFARPTLPLARWQAQGVDVISGRDLEAGGTWMGITLGGRVAMLTNVREPGAEPGPRSRGELPLAWLQGGQDVDGFLGALQPQLYSGFNLLLGDATARRWHWVSNRQPDVHGRPMAGWQHQTLSAGVYGLSNAFLDTPWPKTVKLKQALKQALPPADGDPLNTDLLWQALADDSPVDDADLPHTGMPAQAEHHLASAFVRFPQGHYGTRASTLLAARTSERGLTVHMQEKTWLPEGQTQLREEHLHWPVR